MRRLPHWAAGLEDFLAKADQKQFALGQWDCCIFACGALEAMTGDNPLPNIIGAYDSATSARAYMKTLGPGISSISDAIDFICSRSGLKQVPLTMAKRGDLVVFDEIIDGEIMGACGVVALNGTQIIGVTDRGIKFFQAGPLFHNPGVRAWSI